MREDKVRSMPKEKISATIDEDLLKWARSQVKSKRFASVSHALEYALNELKKAEEKSVRQ
jgi:Arc/MetJ-type ribon-helix-helix transcriptional regulator